MPEGRDFPDRKTVPGVSADGHLSATFALALKPESIPEDAAQALWRMLRAKAEKENWQEFNKNPEQWLRFHPRLKDQMEGAIAKLAKLVPDEMPMAIPPKKRREFVSVAGEMLRPRTADALIRLLTIAQLEKPQQQYAVRQALTPEAQAWLHERASTLRYQGAHSGRGGRA